MMQRLLATVTFGALLGGLSGCVSYERESTPASPTTIVASLVGNWSSLTGTSGTTSSGPCGDIRWQVTNQSGTSANGTFSAACTGGIVLNGTAAGTLNGQVVNWTAAGTATAPGGITCPFTIVGTGNLDGDNIRVNYTATTCVGTFTGSEPLRR